MFFPRRPSITPILRALQARDSDNDLFDIGNQLILFNF